jgi:hypothetical protein
MKTEKNYRLLMQTRSGAMYSMYHDSYWFLYRKMVYFILSRKLSFPDNKTFKFRNGELRLYQDDPPYSFFNPPIRKK